MSATNSTGAKQAWNEMNAEAEATQAIIGGDWLASDTSARPCTNGVQWVITRGGPGSEPDTRAAELDRIDERWRAAGWEPVRSDITGDAPGQQLRYPASGVFEDGFFIEFGTTDNGSTLQIQTPCAPGDADALNREKYGEKHTNTPPYIP